MFLTRRLLALMVVSVLMFPLFADARDLASVHEMKIMAYNVENMFMRLGKYKNMSPEQFKQITDSEVKSPEALKGVAKAILDENPDFIVVEEVEGLEALQVLSRDYLGDAYQAYLKEGNDARGIQVGYLVKRDLALDVTLESHKNSTWVDPNDHKTELVFSRDAPALLVRRQGAPAGSTPLFIFIGNHAKSQRDRPNDPGSHIMRAAQFQAIGQIVDGYQAQYGKDVRVILGGDFNIDVRFGAEMKPLNARLIDAFDAFGIKGIDRMTHTFHQRDGRTTFSQLDALLVSPSLKDSLVSIETYRYKDANGVPKPLPKSYDERSHNPSDHFPIMLTISTDSMLRASGF